MNRIVLTLATLTSAIGLAGAPPAARAAGGAPRIVVADAPTVSDGQGNQSTSFSVLAVYDPVLVTCPVDQPDCNVRQLSFCVGYHTVSGTASANVDFLPASGQLSKTVVVDGPDVIDIGTVPVTVLGDALIEGSEHFSLQLSNGVGCSNDGALADPVGAATIVDGVFGLPDLQVSAIRVVEACEIELTLTNAGTGGVPEAAYHPTAGATVQMRADGQAWGGLRLLGADPSRLLQTPGSSVTHRWFPDTPNLQLAPGLHQLEATVDGNQVVAESVEGNNTRRQRASCLLR
ncbi:MAG: Calx-beta domain-containing protein [Pseudomonadota bacterium]